MFNFVRLEYYNRYTDQTVRVELEREQIERKGYDFNKAIEVNREELQGYVKNCTHPGWLYVETFVNSKEELVKRISLRNQIKLEEKENTL